VARHYLDHASATPTRPEAVAAMLPWFGALADPGRVHAEGLAARVAVEEARERVARLLGARPREVVFTSGHAEAVATAVHGATERGEHIVLSAIEHAAVREASARHRTTVVGADRRGRVDPYELLAAVGPDTGLVHLQWANHEVGTIQPVAEVVAACRARGVLVHVDASTAAGHLPIGFDALGADLLTISGGALGGPPGVGALLIRRGLRLRPLLVGGAQERARRAGVEDVPAIVGLGAAAAVLGGDDGRSGSLDAEAADARRRTRRVLAAVADGSLGLGLAVYGDPVDRVPHLVCLGVPGVESEAVLIGLDQAGVAAHSGSACATEALEPSPVLEAMGVDAQRSLRVSVGWSSTDDDVVALVAALPPVIGRLRSLAG
jgi:cysteine desulfurase